MNHAKFKMMSFLFGISLLLSGCIVQSLHPLYTDENVIFDTRLIGQWSEEGSKEIWEFSKMDKQRYRCAVYVDEDEKGLLEAHLLTIKGKMFLDFFPTEPDDWPSGIFYKLHLLPVHTFAFVKQIEPTLQISFPNMDWLQELLEKNPDAIRHEKRGKHDIILSASTEVLQTFWLAHIDTEGAFDKPIDLQRRQVADQ